MMWPKDNRSIHKSFQRTTGQTTTDGLGVTSTSNSPLTIQKGAFYEKNW